ASATACRLFSCRGATPLRGPIFQGPVAMGSAFAGTTASHLYPREGRLALLHERPAALDEVAAGETVLHYFGAARHVALGFVLHHLADDVLDCLHRERRIDS